MPALRLIDVVASYGKARALSDVSLAVGASETVAILGENGAGKTTLLRCVAGLHRQTRGSIELFGRSVSGKQANLIARNGLSLVRQGAPIFSNVSVAANLDLGRRLAKLRHRQPVPVETVFDWFPILAVKRRQRADGLSGGQKQILAVATALISSPQVLLLDEPSAGLAANVAEQIFQAIGSVRDDDRRLAVLLVEQDVALATRHSDRIHVLRRGILADGRDELFDDEGLAIG